MKIKVNCFVCGVEFERERKTVNQAIKYSQNIYCSKECRIEKQRSGLIKLCENCGSEIYVTKRYYEKSESKKFFCSNSCSAIVGHKNRPKMSEETKNKISKGNKKAYKNNVELRQSAGFGGMTEEQVEKTVKKIKDTWNKKLLEQDFSTLKFDSLKKRVKLEQKGKCNKCGLDEWLGEDIVLEVDHKDGNNQNNDRENLEALCPNCHSQTKTWRGRNKTKRRNVVTDEEIIRSYLKAGNIRQCLLGLGLSAKGANYGRVKRALTLNGIDYN